MVRVCSQLMFAVSEMMHIHSFCGMTSSSKHRTHTDKKMSQPHISICCVGVRLYIGKLQDIAHVDYDPETLNKQSSVSNFSGKNVRKNPFIMMPTIVDVLRNSRPVLLHSTVAQNTKTAPCLVTIIWIRYKVVGASFSKGG